jgi:molybdenum cofactor cytidylyltransferase
VANLKPPTIGAMILAAGSASRMGNPKQLITFDGKSLVRRAIEAAGECRPITVVNGAHESAVVDQLKGLKVRTAFNARWESGMGSSLRVGLADLRAANPNLSAVVILLCDQPHVSAQVIDGLIQSFRAGGKPMAACEYAGTLGPPCCFDQSMFPALEKIGDDQGAKSLLLSREQDVTRYPWEAGRIDLDTPENLQAFWASIDRP